MIKGEGWGQVDEGDEEMKKRSELLLVSLSPFVNFFILWWCESILQKKAEVSERQDEQSYNV